MPRRVTLYWQISNTIVKAILALLYLDILIAAYRSTL